MEFEKAEKSTNPVITRSIVPSAWLLGLCWKVCTTCSNMQCMLDKDLTWFKQSPHQVCQNQESKRKALLAGYHPTYMITVFSKIQLVVYNQCCFLIGWATMWRKVSALKTKTMAAECVLLPKVVLSRYFWPAGWILLKQLFLSLSWPLSQ